MKEDNQAQGRMFRESVVNTTLNDAGSINWDSTVEEDRIIREIVRRARDRVCSTIGLTTRNIKKRRAVIVDLMMDITATHLNGCPLDLWRLLRFPDLDFYHDIYGIMQHIDRRTGKLTGFFLPRCAKPLGE